MKKEGLFDKKAQGMSMNIIVVAAIALLVLVILTLIFTGRISIFTREVQQCKGSCVDVGTCQTGSNAQFKKIDSSGSCLLPDKSVDTTKECCISAI